MSSNVIQTSFAGGELSPTLYARVDLAKYHIGAALLSNFFVDYRGGASTRPGFQLVCRAGDSVKPVRLIPFQFSTIQTYVLQFGDHFMRVIANGAQVLEAAKTITSITKANPGVVTLAGHGFSDGNEVYFLTQGMTQLSGKNYFVANATTNTFQIRDFNGNLVNTAGYGVFTSGTVARVYQVVSPYAAEDLALLKFTQSADVMTITHPSYPIYDLTRTSSTSWTFTPVSIGSSIAAPTGLVGTATGSGTASYAYVVTAVGPDGQESTISNRTDVLNAVNIQATAGSVKLDWNVVPGASGYNVYKANPSSQGLIPGGVLFGFMTSATTTLANTSIDTNIVPDFTVSPPINTNPFAGSNYPGAVAYYQQRKVYAGSNQAPETFWMSRPGQFKNFDVSNPVVASDAITGTLVSRQVNNIKYMVAMPGGLIMLTGGGAWQISGGSGDAAVTPTSIVATPQAYNGCADIEPITINYDILYVQQKGTVVRDLSYSFYTNIYTGADLSVLSNHLFTGYSIKEWAYAEEPFKIVWSVRSDGKLLSLTYLKEQEVFGWAQHSTQGRFQSITTIQEGQENAVYVAVQRYVQGQLVTFIERMHSRQMPYGAEDAWCVDSGLELIAPTPAAVLTLTKLSAAEMRCVASAPVFGAGNVGDVIRAGGGILPVTTYISTTEVRCSIRREVRDIDTFHTPEVIWPQASGSWTLTTPTKVVRGLDHLEGETVAILGDGNVFPSQTVLNGTVTLSQACSKIVVGLGYTCDLQTLYLDVGEPSVQGKRKKIAALTARVDQTRGLSMGPTFGQLTEYKDRNLATIGNPIDLKTGDQRMQIDSQWNTEGQMCLRQAYPLPATVLGVVPEIIMGDTGK